MFESTGILCCHTLAVFSYDRINKVSSCYVLPRWSKNVMRKHTYIRSSHDVARSNESHNLFRHLCSKFYNVAQEFVTCDEEAAMLYSVFSDAKSKLTDYHASMHSTTVAATQNTMPAQSTGGVIDVVDLWTDNDYDASGKKGLEDATIWNASDGGGLRSLLNSFGHS
ncbi:hypothetical protein Ahy_B05g075623 [Arachis hypogaea]|uniref:Protein FAR1-RELATED SEQUENCE n=1 Tax=Arachis hypogaea TaxID=3818 RepID=A0A444Z1N3_ARAHY|nr:hypothetical protein Ahy_B05g075623 [Arachis hypogaea]